MPSSGQALDSGARRFLEPRFGMDFGHVRVHTDATAAARAGALDAAAFTVGNHIAFAAGQYAPATPAGRTLLAHELAHTVQQAGPSAGSHAIGGRPALHLSAGRAGPAIQRQQPRVQVRSPVFEETVTQLSTVAGAVGGRSMMDAERRHAEAIFANSIDYDRVRLVPVDALQFRTVGNNIYIPNDFTIDDGYYAQTLIHELVHVWQYQHSGTSYISVSLVAQIGGALRGSRNIAYDYRLSAGDSFYDFNPEQQGLIVENYYSMLRDQREITASPTTAQYTSNHLDSSGNWQWLSATDRLAEIGRELPLHQPLIDQVRASLPRPETELLQQRATEGIGNRGQDILQVPEERRLTPVRPLVEIRF